MRSREPIEVGYCHSVPIDASIEDRFLPIDGTDSVPIF